VEARDQVGKEIAQTRKAIQDSKDEVAKIAQEVHAIPTDLKATQNSQQAEVEKSQVSEGWRKHQIKSDISHLIEKTKQDNSNG
jgi:phage-related minor tail protein